MEKSTSRKFFQVLNTISNLSSNEIIWRVRFIPENLTKNFVKEQETQQI